MQLAWQQGELSLFLHYGMNTYTDKEWGDGTESPKLFNPTGLNATQWAIVAKETGFKFMVIVAKVSNRTGQKQIKSCLNYQ